MCDSHITEVIEKWGIESQVVAILSDRRRNIVKGIVEHTAYDNVNCLAHNIQRAVPAGFKVASMHDLLSKCRKIVGHFKHSSTEATNLAFACKDKEIKHLNLVQDVATRWFLSLAMAERLVMQKEAIISVLSNIDKFGITLSQTEFLHLENLIKLLKQVKEISDFLGGESYVMGSCYIFAICKLEQIMGANEEYPAYVIRFKNAFQMQELPSHCLLQEAAVDTHFKRLKGLSPQKKEEIYPRILEHLAGMHDEKQHESMEPLLKKMTMCKSLADDSDSEEDTESNKRKCELNMYRAIKPELLATDPLDLWEKNQAAFPRMAAFEKRSLCITATSVPCERLLSSAGCIVEERRSSLLLDNIEKLVCLKNWLI
ncbi:UNVERIFIED_CONTAM: hypothetical protein FKN15_054423 [Acipenser sinensis]